MDQVTKRKEERSRDVLRYCRYTTERSPLPMVAVEGLTHIVRYVNPAFCVLAGKTRAELIDRPFPAAIPAEARNACMALLDRVYRTGEAENLAEQEASHVPDSLAFWTYAVWAILDENENISGVMIQVTNATEAAVNRLYLETANEKIRAINQELVIAAVREQEQAEVAVETQQQLLQARKMEGIGRLAGGIAHDFNNLLTAILGYAELAGEELGPNAAVHVYLDNIQNAAARAATLTQQLLAFARKQVIEPRIVNLNMLVSDTSRMLGRLLGEHIEFVTNLNPDLGQVKIDPGQFGQVLMNLIVNARDALPEGGTLTIETTNLTLHSGAIQPHYEVAPGDYILLTVRDTGTGMTEETKSHLFEPFFTTKAPGKGTGLGLATCYGIVKQSGGHIQVESEPGSGTTFHIYFPRTVDAADPMPKEASASLLPGNEVIFLVEDEEIVRFVGAQALRRQGYMVVEASNGNEALCLLESYPGSLDLLITDVVMPQMGGKELADRLRVTHPRVKVLYTSGYTDEAIVHQGVLDPGLAFLQKPFTPAALAQKVRELLDELDEMGLE